MFVIEGASARRRTDQDRFDAPPPISSVPGCYTLGSELADLCVEVNAESSAAVDVRCRRCSQPGLECSRAVGERYV